MKKINYKQITELINKKKLSKSDKDKLLDFANNEIKKWQEFKKKIEETKQTKWEKFVIEYDKFLEEDKRICINCLEKRFKKYIGNKKTYDSYMKANTIVIDKCEICGKKNGRLPYQDLYLAIKASQGYKIHWASWD